MIILLTDWRKLGGSGYDLFWGRPLNLSGDWGNLRKNFVGSAGPGPRFETWPLEDESYELLDLFQKQTLRIRCWVGEPLVIYGAPSNPHCALQHGGLSVRYLWHLPDVFKNLGNESNSCCSWLCTSRMLSSACGNLVSFHKPHHDENVDPISRHI
jgi:hypothetical protein